MNALVVFYSRTGNTRNVARAIADALKCDIEEIVDTKDRSGAIGYIFAGRDASMKVPAPIKPPLKDPSQYDLVIIGTPVWAWTVSAPVRAYLSQNRERLKQVAFFCTHSGSESKAFAEMENLCGKKPVDTLGVMDKAVDASLPKVREFVKKLV